MKLVQILVLSFSFLQSYGQSHYFMRDILPRIVNRPVKPESSEASIPVGHLTAAHLTEYTLLRDLNSCLQMTFCTVGTQSRQADIDDLSHRRVPKPLALADGIRSAVVTFKEVLKVVKGRQPMPHMRQLVASFDLGMLTRSKNLCMETFNCETPPSDIKIRPVGKSLWTRSTTSEDCRYIRSICPGLTSGCTLCSTFTPGKSCFKSCSMGSMFCGAETSRCS